MLIQSAYCRASPFNSVLEVKVVQKQRSKKVPLNYSCFRPCSETPETDSEEMKLEEDRAHPDKLVLHDVFVFAGLELLGTLAVTGNICLIIVLLRNKYLHRARLATLIIILGEFLIRK